MFTNKVVRITLGILAIVVLPIQLITTFVLSIMVELSFGILLLPFSLVWAILFYGPLIAMSYLFEKVIFFRPCISLLGIPCAVLGNIYVALIPSMGEFDSRYSKMLICQTFPYSLAFVKFMNYREIGFYDHPILSKILLGLSKEDVAFDSFIKKISYSKNCD